MISEEEYYAWKQQGRKPTSTDKGYVTKPEDAYVAKREDGKIFSIIEDDVIRISVEFPDNPRELNEVMSFTEPVSNSMTGMKAVIENSQAFHQKGGSIIPRELYNRYEPNLNSLGLINDDQDLRYPQWATTKHPAVTPRHKQHEQDLTSPTEDFGRVTSRALQFQAGSALPGVFELNPIPGIGGHDGNRLRKLQLYTGHPQANQWSGTLIGNSMIRVILGILKPNSLSNHPNTIQASLLPLNLRPADLTDENPTKDGVEVEKYAVKISERMVVRVYNERTAGDWGYMELTFQWWQGTTGRALRHPQTLEDFPIAGMEFIHVRAESMPFNPGYVNWYHRHGPTLWQNAVHHLPRVVSPFLYYPKKKTTVTLAPDRSNIRTHTESHIAVEREEVALHQLINGYYPSLARSARSTPTFAYMLLREDPLLICSAAFTHTLKIQDDRRNPPAAIAPVPIAQAAHQRGKTMQQLQRQKNAPPALKQASEKEEDQKKPAAQPRGKSHAALNRLQQRLLGNPQPDQALMDPGCIDPPPIHRMVTRQTYGVLPHSQDANRVPGRRTKHTARKEEQRQLRARAAWLNPHIARPIPGGNHRLPTYASMATNRSMVPSRRSNAPPRMNAAAVPTHERRRRRSSPSSMQSSQENELADAASISGRVRQRRRVMATTDAATGGTSTTGTKSSSES